MAEIDIRDYAIEQPSSIRFADGNQDGYADTVSPFDNPADYKVKIENTLGDIVLIESKVHAENLIKALEQVIKYRWIR